MTLGARPDPQAQLAATAPTTTAPWRERLGIGAILARSPFQESAGG